MWNDQDFNSTFSSPTAGKENRKILPKHIVPVTAEIINKCTQVENENSIFEYNHLKFNQICFIGVIKNVIKRANDITYLIDDMTSTNVNVKLQSDEQDDMESEEARPAQSQFMENQYVKVHGVIKSLQGQKVVQAYNIRPVKELNEVTQHMLECMNASIHYVTKAGESMDMSTSSHAQKGGTFNNQQSNLGLTGLNNQIASFVKGCKNSEGLHLKDICERFGSIPQAKIRDALEFLSTEGHIYTTVDDEHFKSTDNN